MLELRRQACHLIEPINNIYADQLTVVIFKMIVNSKKKIQAKKMHWVQNITQVIMHYILQVISVKVKRLLEPSFFYYICTYLTN